MTSCSFCVHKGTSYLRIYQIIKQKLSIILSEEIKYSQSNNSQTRIKLIIRVLHASHILNTYFQSNNSQIKILLIIKMLYTQSLLSSYFQSNKN